MQKGIFMKNLIRVGALLLCVFFFSLPLVQCSQDSSYSASGWEISTGTGKLFDKNDNGYPLAFLLIIIPVILLIVSFTSDSFAILRNVSIAGVLAEVIFLIYANSLLNSGERKGAFELTGFNWLVLGIYIGICAIAFYCAKNESESNYVKRRTVNKKCRQCENVYSGSSVCPKCGSSFYDEVNNVDELNSSNLSPILSISKIDDNLENKKCKNCNLRVSIDASRCPKCGCSDFIYS
jgi:RNA polymerase subunit RPABC4/transcription elongation factor Spt4